MTAHNKHECSADSYRPDIEYIFISESSIIGGIETLFVRMAKSLSLGGRRVTLLAPPGPLIESLPHSVHHIEATPRSMHEAVRANYEPSPGCRHISIWCSHPFLLRQAYEIQASLHLNWNIPSNALSGIFIPAQWDYSDRISELRSIGLLRLLPPGCIYFMSDAVKDSFQSRYGRPFRNWQVQRLALSDSSIDWGPTSSALLNIVSVGRLTHFKAYNLGASDITKRLKENGIPCRWTIWGDGEDLEKAKLHARDRGVSDDVLFRGPLPYHLLDEEVCRYDIFVGMGTAALEAARCGVPTIVALADSPDSTYGFLNECPKDSIGESISGTVEKKIIDLLEAFYRAPTPHRKQIGRACRDAVRSRVQADADALERELAGGMAYPPRFQTKLRMRLIDLLSIASAAARKGSKK